MDSKKIPLSNNSESSEEVSEMLKVPMSKDFQTINCIGEWEDLNPNMFDVLKKSEGFSEDEHQNKEIVDFLLKGKDVLSKDSLKQEFAGFPEYFYQYIAQASQDKFKVLVKEQQALENHNAIWSITRENVKPLQK